MIAVHRPTAGKPAEQLYREVKILAMKGQYQLDTLSSADRTDR